MRFLKYFWRLVGELIGFAWQNKAWWIIPVVAVLLLVTALIFMGGSAPAFIYTFF